MADKRKSGVQKLFTGLVSPAMAAKMEAESRTWMLRCPHCGYERSYWETGGVMYKAAGNRRELRRCPHCGRLGWHLVYRRKGSQAEPSADALAPEVRAPAAAPALGVGPPSPTARGRLDWLPRGLRFGLLIAVLDALIIVSVGYAFVRVWPSGNYAVLALLIAVFVALVLVVARLTAGWFTQPVVNTGYAFMIALRSGNYAAAYALCMPALQQELNGERGLATRVQPHQPARWEWTQRSLINGMGRLGGSLTYADGQTGRVYLVVQPVGNGWKIVSFYLDPT